jgi:hypothetical protein
MRNSIRTNTLRTTALFLPFLALQAGNLEAAILFSESFETDGEGTRYTSTGSFTDGADDYFTRTDGSTEASGIPAFSGFDGTYFWAAEDIDAAENTSGVALLEFTGIDLASFPAVQISLQIGAGSNSAFDNVDDFVLVEYRVDAGPWQSALAFQNNGQTFNGPLLQDTDFDTIGDGVELGLVFQGITSQSLSTPGSFLDLRIDTLMTSGSEAVGFDNIQVIGVPEPGTSALAFGVTALLLMAARRFLPRREDESQT